MTSSLMREFVAAQKKSGVFDTTDLNFYQQTGIDLLDMHNGSYEEKTGMMRVGVNRGRMMMVVGESGSGKTTLAIQAAIGIVRGIEHANVFHYDVEQSTRTERIKSLISEMGASDSVELDKNYHHMSRHVHTEVFQELVEGLYKFKREHEDEIMVDIEDINGVVHKVPSPTVIILDSLPRLVPERVIDSENASKGMQGGDIAKTNNMLLRQILGKMSDMNIHFFVINHIQAAININPMARKAKKLNYLGEGEHIPGGSGQTFYTDYLLKLVPRGKLKETEGFGIKGFLTEVKVLKSRGAPSGRDFVLCYDQVRGFDNDYSNVMALTVHDLIEGNGRSYYFKDKKDVGTFTRKNFKEKMAGNEKLREAYNEAMSEYFHDKLPIINKEG